MSFYRKATEIGKKFFGNSTLYKYGFNFSPMYRRSTGKIIAVSKDLNDITIKIPISWKNRNYMNTIFGGSMFSAVDPIPMIQLVQLLGDDYIVWDKSAEIFFKRPAKEDLYAKFSCSNQELQNIKNRIAVENEFDYVVQTNLTNKSGDVLYCQINKTVYIANKNFYKQKQINRIKNRNLA